MTILQAIILGIVQGLTEFLPVSSSAHLVFTPFLFGWEIPAQDEFIFDVLVQMGTLCAVIVYFWKDLVQIARLFLLGIVRRQPFSDPYARLGWYLILATLPAVAAGILFKDLVEQAFGSPLASAFFLLGTAVLLVVAERIGQRRRQLEQVNAMDALVIGLFQAAALLPGISRSGATITGGMLRSLDRQTAARFSFLMSVPVMVGAALVTMTDLAKIPGFAAQIPTLLAGFFTSAVVGYLSIRWLLSFLVRHRLYAFSIYCAGISLLVLSIWFLRG